MNAALVIMAAGLGSRYGGNKQVDGVGPNGEVLMEYSIHDAIRAGFTKVVFIVKPEILGLVRTLCGDSLRGKTTRGGKPLEVCYAFQDFESLPAFYTLPAGRTKPFGTTHAVLCARDYVNEPFCVINADDYYGVDAYRAMYDELCRLPQSGRATMVGYLLKNTVSLNGTVSRGICRVENGELTGVKEALKIQLYPDGHIADIADGTPRPLDPDTPVSMNFWGFTPAIFDELETYFEAFPLGRCKDQHQGGVPAAEHGRRPARARPSACVGAALGGSLVRHDVPRGSRDRRRRAPPPARNRRLPRQAVTPHVSQSSRRARRE